MKLKLGFLLIFGGYIYGDTSYQSCLDNSPQMGWNTPSKSLFL